MSNIYVWKTIYSFVYNQDLYYITHLNIIIIIFIVQFLAYILFHYLLNFLWFFYSLKISILYFFFLFLNKKFINFFEIQLILNDFFFLVFIFNIAICKDPIWTHSPRMRRTKAQRAQNNEFVESGLETEYQWVVQ